MKKKILFVDDEEDMRIVVKILLKNAGYDITVHEDDGFVNRIETDEVPDLYLLDRRLGNVDALELCYVLKTHPKTKHIPVIMVSADPNVKDLYKDAGADAFISKPFESDAFLETVAGFLKRA